MFYIFLILYDYSCAHRCISARPRISALIWGRFKIWKLGRPSRKSEACSQHIIKLIANCNRSDIKTGFSPNTCWNKNLTSNFIQKMQFFDVFTLRFCLKNSRKFLWDLIVRIKLTYCKGKTVCMVLMYENKDQFYL